MLFKKFIATAAALFLGIGLSFIAVAAPASATHPAVQGTVSCNPTTGTFDITWRVTGDTSYPNETATIKEVTITSSKAGETPTTTTSLINKTVKGGGFVEAVQQNATVGAKYKMTVKVQWTNHKTGDLVSKTSSEVKPSGTCVPKDTVDCVAAVFYKGSPLTDDNYINLKYTQYGSGERGLSAEINKVQPANGDPASESGLYVLVTGDASLAGLPAKYPLSNADVASGVFTFNYSSYLTGQWTTTWVQWDSHNDHFKGELKCGSTAADAAASVTITPATCDAAAGLVLNDPTNAEWTTTGPVTTTYSVVATAKNGHTFPADASAGVLVSDDGKTKTFTGTLDPKKSPYSEDCGDLATPVEPDVTTVTKCGVYGTVAPQAREGVAYVVDFNPTTGDYTVTATPEAGYFFAGGVDDQIVTYKGSVGAYYDCVDTKVTLDVVGVCVYDTDAVAADRTATITYDNTGSTKAILFTGIPGGPTDPVPAGQKVTFDITVGAAGASYTVTADGKTYPVEIAACPEYTKPKDDVDEKSTEKMICSPDNQVEISTTTTTTSYVFNPTTKTWDAQTPVVTGPVITYRDMTDDEKEQNCGFTLDTDPRSSQCKVVDNGTQLASWIYVDTDPRVIYTITNVVTNAVTTPASGYVSVPAGKYTITAVAAPGYVLNPSAPKVWIDVFVQDTTKCSNTDLGLLTPTAKATQPTCTAAGSYTLGGLEGAQFNWTVNGSATTVPNGTYEAPKEGGEVVLVAMPVNPSDGLQDWVNPVTLKFDAAPSAAACGDLPTLALTGTGVSLQLTLVGALLGLAGIGFFLAGRRLRNGQ